MLTHSYVRYRLRTEKYFSSRNPHRQMCPTTSESDVRLSCSDRDHVRSGPKLARPRAIAHFWGSGARVLQRVQEYHNAPPGLTAKSPRKSSIFSRLPCCRPVPFPGSCGLAYIYRCSKGRFSSETSLCPLNLRAQLEMILFPTSILRREKSAGNPAY